MKKGWEIKKISSIGKVYNGNSINEEVKKEKYTGRKDGLPFIATKDVSFDSVIDYDNGVKIPFEELKSFKIAPKNSVFICAEGGSAGRKIGFTDQDVCFGNKLFALKIDEDINSRYIYYYYFSSTFQKQFSTEKAGLIGGVSMNKFKEIEIPIPSLSDQNLIVAILDESFVAIAKAKENAEKNLANAREVFESSLQSVFTNPNEGWELRRLSDVCLLIMGQSPDGRTYNTDGIGMPLINGPVEFGPEPFSKTIKSKYTTAPTKLCKEGDLILCVRGSTTGRTNIAGFDACIGRGVASLRYVSNQLWINYFIISQRDRIFKLGTGSTFPNVSTSILGNLLIPLPPFTEQQEIITNLDSLSADTKKLESIYKQKLADLEELKKSILEKAFNGELNINKR